MHSEARAPEADLDALFRAERGSLWGIAYRLTGTAADADDVVQEAFARAVTVAPQASRSEPKASEDQRAGLAPWLVRVVTNLAIDVLRRRKRRRYEGPWLPAPCEDDGAEPDRLAPRAGEAHDPEHRYGLSESATFAFLIALEALAPRPRAALLLRDVLGYSARETATALAISEANVRVLHLRGRRALAGYDLDRCVPDAALRARHQEVLERLHRCLLAQDTSGLEALFTESVRTVTDANGEYTALAQPMTGRARVSRFYQMAALHRQTSDARSEIRIVNGLPALLTVLHAPVRRQAPRSVLRVELDPDGLIHEVQVVLAPSKLGAVRFA
jgi:RNA polymerase sigma-70 factor (ECF subfamily)